ncbi:MAG: alkaline phosphatase PhoX, partial [Rhodoferax sp.]
MTRSIERPSDIFNNEDSNTSDNLHFDSVLSTRLSRRNVLRSGASAAATAMLGGAALSGCATDGTMTGAMAGSGEKMLGFTAVPKSLADTVTVPPGYKVDIIYALGDPILPGASAFQNDGTDADFDKRAGDHHDGMEWFGLSADGQPSRSSVERGLLAVNHEATTDEKLSSFF